MYIFEASQGTAQASYRYSGRVLVAKNQACYKDNLTQPISATTKPSSRRRLAPALWLYERIHPRNEAHVK